MLSKNLSRACTEERLATEALIEHLEEISHRMRYAEMGYASLWEFATIELGLSEGAAQRRIQAMPRDRDRIVAATEERELMIVVSPELHDQLQRIKGLLAHTLPHATYADLLQYMATETLNRLEKKKGIAAPAAAAAVTPVALPIGRRVYLPAPLRHEAFRHWV